MLAERVDFEYCAIKSPWQLTLAPTKKPTAATTRALRAGLSFGQICFTITLNILHPDNSTVSSVTYAAECWTLAYTGEPSNFYNKWRLNLKQDEIKMKGLSVYKVVMHR